MICCKCKAEIRDIAVFCDQCGARQIEKKKATRHRTRGNGQGSVVKLPNGKYKAIVTVGYEMVDGKKKVRRRCHTFDKKKDAVAALATLAAEQEKPKTKITFKQLYDAWLPTHEVKRDKKTMDCYKAAMKHFTPVWDMAMSDIDIDDLQDCLDTCGRGKRTQENMKTTCGLIYKYGIPRHSVPENLNLADFLKVCRGSAAERESFTSDQIQKIKDVVGKADYADYVYCLIYLGYRPSEFLTLDVSDYDSAKKFFVHGAKTEAGIDRAVTISPKIQSYIDALTVDKTDGAVFCKANGSRWTLRDFTEKAFYPVLEAAGIDNPMVEIAPGLSRHKYTPHSCRHTFATLMKNIDAPTKDKLKLIGHTSEEMLMYYQSTNVDDLRKITDII